MKKAARFPALYAATFGRVSFLLGFLPKWVSARSERVRPFLIVLAQIRVKRSQNTWSQAQRFTVYSTEFSKPRGISEDKTHAVDGKISQIGISFGAFVGLAFVPAIVFATALPITDTGILQIGNISGSVVGITSNPKNCIK
jgi:hypothetical protein